MIKHFDGIENNNINLLIQLYKMGENIEVYELNDDESAIYNANRMSTIPIYKAFDINKILKSRGYKGSIKKLEVSELFHSIVVEIDIEEYKAASPRCALLIVKDKYLGVKQLYLYSKESKQLIKEETKCMD